MISEGLNFLPMEIKELEDKISEYENRLVGIAEAA
jgi:hypothetical protein